MTTDTPIDPSNPLAKTQNQLAIIIETLLHLGVLVHDFQGTEDAKIGLTSLMSKLITQLQVIDKPEESLDKVPIPLDVLQYIEDGRNPDVYTREFVESVRKSNQYLKGKTLAFTRLRDTLGDQIISEFPELKDEVQDIIKRTN
ncbi:hypothetical protein PACTADRAFT_76437 [Pachysolen tannophilus NRRL Y-2460]|uniref:Mediator of RNA polymerase II transcription subunit 10 n=1 Tax=Pachysolen tannophilus NRRL Y-2460 TaxID=669874 RepID=A0A1E4TSW6_PACTA|nr:hypothetical protein PACTADRAFT_76437 [Pachysolen tannophilus NRRL Y-2460]